MENFTAENFSQYLIAAQSQGIFLVSKIFFIIISLLFLAAIIYVVRSSGYFQIRFWQDLTEIFTYKPYGAGRIVKKWNKIKSRLDLPSESEHKLAVIEADDILDDILKRMGYKGETLGDRLKQLTPAQFSGLEQLMEAHKIRNNIVHDPDYRLSLDQARKTLEIYEKAFQDLQAI